MTNHVGMDGIEFIEFAAVRSDDLARVFMELGLANTMKHERFDLRLYERRDVRFLVNCCEGTVAHSFYQQHGPGVSAMGWRVRDAREAVAIAVKNGARQASQVDYQLDGKEVPAIEGVGGSLIYFIDTWHDSEMYTRFGLQRIGNTKVVHDTGFASIDHLANHVEQGQLQKCSEFYQRTFGFTEAKYFDVSGEHTGMKSLALHSPCGKFSIPISEGVGEKSSINEFVEAFNGSGMQHIALLTENMLGTLRQLQDTSIKTLEMYDEYYDNVFEHVTSVDENHAELQKFNVLVDGDNKGYLLQIFTRNVVGPMCFEFIQRKNNNTFGEGNFQALFRAIEIEQKKRGFLG